MRKCINKSLSAATGNSDWSLRHPSPDRLQGDNGGFMRWEGKVKILSGRSSRFGFPSFSPLFLPQQEARRDPVDTGGEIKES